MAIIKEGLKRIWNAEEIRTLVLVSLCLQFGLVFLSPLRKRTGQKLLKLLLWFFYLVADYVAILALGNLLKRQNEGASCCRGDVGLMAFWAPFLLLHLGGPDTITSYSIEDNELWWRHFLGLVVQVVSAFIVLVKLVAIPRLRVATAIVFIAGLIKYSERTWALRSSSMDQLRKSRLEPGSNWFDDSPPESEESEESGDNEPPPPPQFPFNINAPGNIYDTVQIIEAYVFFKIFKPFVVDHRLSMNQRVNSKTYIWNCGVWKAFKVVEIELSFLYDVLHTKAIVINGLCGCLWRFISLGMISSAFVLFLKSEKRGHAKANIIISYILFGSALFMEFISLLLIITSDWMIVTLITEKKHSLLKNLAVVIAKVMSCFFPNGKRRWSNSVAQYSLLSFSLREKKTIFRWILGAVKVKELWDNFFFVRSVCVPWELKELLFGVLKSKTTRANERSDFEELRDLKLEKVLEHMELTENELTELGNLLRLEAIERVKIFDEVMLLWHIATDLCFHTHGAMNDNNSHSSDCKISLIMSNYMMYLLIMQPSIMPNGIDAIRKFKKIYTEAKNIFRAGGKGFTKEVAREAYFRVMDSRGLEESREISVLRGACDLAKKLNEMPEYRRWGFISRVWVEMMCYAAINCKTYYHSKQLSQGGELLTHVMLLMVHMGIPQKSPSATDIWDGSFPLYN